jgi:hypothetical protein
VNIGKKANGRLNSASWDEPKTFTFEFERQKSTVKLSLTNRANNLAENDSTAKDNWSFSLFLSLSLSLSLSIGKPTFCANFDNCECKTIDNCTFKLTVTHYREREKERERERGREDDAGQDALVPKGNAHLNKYQRRGSKVERNRVGISGVIWKDNA